MKKAKLRLAMTTKTEIKTRNYERYMGLNENANS